MVSIAPSHLGIILLTSFLTLSLNIHSLDNKRSKIWCTPDPFSFCDSFLLEHHWLIVPLVIRSVISLSKLKLCGVPVQLWRNHFACSIVAQGSVLYLKLDFHGKHQWSNNILIWLWSCESSLARNFLPNPATPHFKVSFKYILKKQGANTTEQEIRAWKVDRKWEEYTKGLELCWKHIYYWLIWAWGDGGLQFWYHSLPTSKSWSHHSIQSRIPGCLASVWKEVSQTQLCCNKGIQS